MVRTIIDRSVRFFVEPTLKDFIHACTVDDIACMLAHVPAGDWEGIEAILLRQPKRKENLLEPVWGRLSYAADLVDQSGRVLYQGPMIIIEAINPSKSFRFGKSHGPDGLAELERLKSDGHIFRAGDPRHTLTPTLEACRNTQLYRTFLHELGHWVDFLEKVERPPAEHSPEDYSARLGRFHSRPVSEKEQFAHRYAAQIGARLTAAKVIPFERQMDPARVLQDNLALGDFLPFGPEVR